MSGSCGLGFKLFSQLDLFAGQKGLSNQVPVKFRSKEFWFTFSFELILYILPNTKNSDQQWAHFMDSIVTEVAGCPSAFSSARTYPKPHPSIILFRLCRPRIGHFLLSRIESCGSVSGLFNVQGLFHPLNPCSCEFRVFLYPYCVSAR